MQNNDLFVEISQRERTIRTLSAERSFFAVLCIALFVWGVFFAHSDQIKEQNQTISDLQDQLSDSESEVELLQGRYDDLLEASGNSSDLLTEKAAAAAYIADGASFLYDAVRIVPVTSGSALVYHRYGCPQLEAAQTVLVMTPSACKEAGLQACPDCSAATSETAQTFRRNLDAVKNLTQRQSTTNYIQDVLD